MLTGFITESLEASTAKQLFDGLISFASQFGIDALSYHILVAQLRQVTFESGFIFDTFPKEWVTRYSQCEYFKIDPILQHSRVATEPFRWYQVDQYVDVTRTQLRYLVDLRRHGLVDGFAIPIQAGSGTVAYFGAGTTNDVLEISDAEILTFQFACNQVHRRFIELRGGLFSETKPLTERETEVLQWLAYGKSKSVIADILGISPHTVDSLTRRCFQKLDTNDKVNAVLRGATLGLIQIQ